MKPTLENVGRLLAASSTAPGAAQVIYIGAARAELDALEEQARDLRRMLIAAEAELVRVARVEMERKAEP